MKHFREKQLEGVLRDFVSIQTAIEAGVVFNDQDRQPYDPFVLLRKVAYAVLGDENLNDHNWIVINTTNNKTYLNVFVPKHQAEASTIWFNEKNDCNELGGHFKAISLQQAVQMKINLKGIAF